MTSRFFCSGKIQNKCDKQLVLNSSDFPNTKFKLKFSGHGVSYRKRTAASGRNHSKTGQRKRIRNLTGKWNGLILLVKHEVLDKF